MARYEKTIATGDFVFNIALPGSPTLVVDLLPSSATQRITNLLSSLDILDGYITCASSFTVSRTHEDAGTETVAANEKYLCPMENWINQVLVSGSGTATIRILFN